MYKNMYGIYVKKREVRARIPCNTFNKDSLNE